MPKAALIRMPFCLLLWFHRNDEDLCNWIFIRKDLSARPATRADACVFSASLLQLKWKWPCCGAYGSANGARLQLFSRRRGKNIPLALERTCRVVCRVWGGCMAPLSCGVSLRISLIPFLFTTVVLKFGFR